MLPPIWSNHLCHFLPANIDQIKRNLDNPRETPEKKYTARRAVSPYETMLLRHDYVHKVVEVVYFPDSPELDSRAQHAATL
jgi:hypothetical protein